MSAVPVGGPGAGAGPGDEAPAGTLRLAEAPSLPRMYVSAAGAAARARLTGAERSMSLPAQRHLLDGAGTDLERLTAFQRLVHLTIRDTVPSGYLHVLAFPVAMSIMTRDDFPLPLLGMVHVRNEVDHFRPVHYSETLAVTAWAERLRGHRSGTQVDLLAEISAGGGVIWRGRSTYLAKGVFDTALDGALGTAPGPEAGQRPDYQPPVQTGQWQLGMDTGRAYAAVSGDFNPIHLSALSARALGLKRPIAHGMYLAARVLADLDLAQEVPARWWINFDSPVYLPSTVALAITDTGPEADAGAAQPGAWPGSVFEGWNPRSRRRHFRGEVAPL